MLNFWAAILALWFLLFPDTLGEALSQPCHDFMIGFERARETNEKE